MDNCVRAAIVVALCEERKLVLVRACLCVCVCEATEIE